MCLVAFAGFMRCDELIRLRCEDITFNAEGMIINIVSSKTDQYREGSSLVIARTGGLTCPVGSRRLHNSAQNKTNLCGY